MDRFGKIFGCTKAAVVGMLHLRALPGSVKSSQSLEDITRKCCAEAQLYQNSEVDGLLLENMHDLPWNLPHQMGPETTACMTRVATEVRARFPHLPIGIQVLSAANKEALAVAKAAGLNFIRAEGFVFSHVGDEGPIHACAAELVRYRKLIGAEDVLIFTDVKKKHSSHAVTADVSLAETARAAELFMSDGIIVTGTATGEPAEPQHLTDVQRAVDLPVLIGSGVNAENLGDYMSANALIVGSSLKENGVWSGALDEARVKRFTEKLRQLRDEAKHGHCAGSA